MAAQKKALVVPEADRDSGGEGITEYTHETLRGILPKWLQVGRMTLADVASLIEAHANAWQASDNALPGGSPAGAWELVKRMREHHATELEAANDTGRGRGRRDS